MTASAPAWKTCSSHSSSMRSVSSSTLACGRLLADLTQAQQRVRRVLHVVDEDDVRAQLDEVTRGGLAAVDEADDLEAGRLAQGQTDGVDHE